LITRDVEIISPGRKEIACGRIGSLPTSIARGLRAVFRPPSSSIRAAASMAITSPTRRTSSHGTASPRWLSTASRHAARGERRIIRTASCNRRRTRTRSPVSGRSQVSRGTGPESSCWACPEAGRRRIPLRSKACATVAGDRRALRGTCGDYAGQLYVRDKCKRSLLAKSPRWLYRIPLTRRAPQPATLADAFARM